ncbi:hypothetical protein [Streptomyces sp. NPDC049590]|uniref:hypothetical protein n=1 Tax=Streptomyces sp. NPDC049590 TaxID=3154834 RepID=UPI003415A5CC
MALIADNLHCDAVRLSGGDAERLSSAARHAADAGLEVWFSPFPADLPPGRILPFFADCAQRAEALRQDGAQVVLVAGCELSAFAHGFLPGDTYLDRLHAMATADIQWWTSLGPVHLPCPGRDDCPRPLRREDHLRVRPPEYGTCAYRGAGDLGGMAWQPPQGAIPDEEGLPCHEHPTPAAEQPPRLT